MLQLDGSTHWNYGDRSRIYRLSCSGNGGNVVRNPGGGSYAAYNMFDGTGPLAYQLSQTINVLDGITAASLSWTETASWEFGGEDAPSGTKYGTETENDLTLTVYEI